MSSLKRYPIQLIVPMKHFREHYQVSGAFCINRTDDTQTIWKILEQTHLGECPAVTLVPWEDSL